MPITPQKKLPSIEVHLLAGLEKQMLLGKGKKEYESTGI